MQKKPLSSFTPEEIPYTREIFDPAYSKSISLDEPKSGSASKTTFPYYSSGSVTTNISQKNGATEKVESGNYEKTGEKNPDGSDKLDYTKPIMVDKEVPSKVGMYNGNLYSSPNEQPKNVPIDPPNQVYDIDSGKWLGKNEIGIGVWTVSLVKDGTVYRKQNSTGGYNWLGYDPNVPTPDTKGYTPMQMVQITVQSADGDKTYLIPKTGDIAEYISKLKREEGGGSTTTQTTETKSAPKTLKTKSGITFTVQ